MGTERITGWLKERGDLVLLAIAWVVALVAIVGGLVSAFRPGGNDPTLQPLLELERTIHAMDEELRYRRELSDTYVRELQVRISSLSDEIQDYRRELGDFTPAPVEPVTFHEVRYVRETSRPSVFGSIPADADCDCICR